MKENDSAMKEGEELLTIDELRSMNGQPIWLVDFRTKQKKGEWVLFADGEEDDEAKYCYYVDSEYGYFDYAFLSYKYYGRFWAAYRNKPDKKACFYPYDFYAYETEKCDEDGDWLPF